MYVSFSILPVRHAVYNPTYLEPTISKDLLSEQISSQDERHYRPIKPARKQDSSSLFYDPLIEYVQPDCSYR